MHFGVQRYEQVSEKPNLIELFRAEVLSAKPKLRISEHKTKKFTDFDLSSESSLYKINKIFRKTLVNT